MAVFTYTALDGQGAIRNGEMGAESREEAIATLEQEFQRVISIKEQTTTKKWWQIAIGGKRLSQKDIILITKRMSTMIGHGFSVIDCLRSIELQTQDPKLKRIIGEIKSKVELGTNFSDTLKSYPESFSTAYISIVKVGEESGKLSEVLGYLVRQETQLYELKKKAISAMIYPSVIIGLMVTIAIGMIIFLIPFLNDIFGSFDADLPAATVMLMKAEPILRSYWWALLAGLIGMYFCFSYLKALPNIKIYLDQIIIKLPFFGKLFRQYNIARITRTFATLNVSGVPMGQSLDILTTVPNNIVYKRALEVVRENVDKGMIFSEALSKYESIFSLLVIESIRLGEKTGNLNDSSVYLAELYEEELKDSLGTITTLIQPLLLVLVGVMVAGFALAVITPLQKLPQMIQQQATN